MFQYDFSNGGTPVTESDFWNTFAAIGSLIVSTVAILITILLFRHDKHEKKKQRKQELKDLNEFLRNSLQRTTHYLLLQINYLEKTIQQMEHSGSYFRAVPVESYLTVEPILRIPISEVFQAFMASGNENKISNYNKFIYTIYAVPEIIKHLEKYNDEFRLITKSKIELLKQALGRVVDFMNVNQKDSDSRELIDGLSKIIDSTRKIDGMDVIALENILIIPLQELCENQKISSKLKPELIILINDCHIARSELVDIRDSYLEFFKKVQKLFDDMKNRLLEVSF